MFPVMPRLEMSRTMTQPLESNWRLSGHRLEDMREAVPYLVGKLLDVIL